MVECSRECPIIDVAASIRAGRVSDRVAQFIREYGALRELQSSTPEFAGRTAREWQADEGIPAAQIDARDPCQNGAYEGVNAGLDVERPWSA